MREKEERGGGGGGGGGAEQGGRPGTLSGRRGSEVVQPPDMVQAGRGTSGRFVRILQHRGP